jgi:replication factor A2
MGGQGFGTFADAGAGGKSAEKKGAKERQSLIPVTIKQLMSAENSDDVFKVDGAELFTIKIVGLIDSTEEHATNHTFQISDSSGAIECKKWIERDGKKSEKQDQCVPNTLVRVCGCLREYEGRRHVLVYDMTPITDWNEMTHHFLESIMVHLQHTRGPINGGGGQKMEQASFSSPGKQIYYLASEQCYPTCPLLSLVSLCLVS